MFGDWSWVEYNYAWAPGRGGPGHTGHCGPANGRTEMAVRPGLTYQGVLLDSNCSGNMNDRLSEAFRREEESQFSQRTYDTSSFIQSFEGHPTPMDKASIE